jgi:putative ABC transport system permease protein
VTVNRGALLWAGADLRRRWRGALFLALLAGLGAGVVLAAVVGIRRTDSALDRAIAERRVADAIVEVSTPDDISVILARPEVVEGDTADMYLGQIDGAEFDAFAIVPHGGWGTDFDTIELTAGRLADPTVAHEVVLPRTTAAEIGVGVGDTFTLRTVSPGQLRHFFGLDGVEGTGGPAGPAVELVVVGLGDTLANEVETAEGMMFATPAFDNRYDTVAGHLGGHGVGGLVAVRLRNGQVDLPAFEAGARAALGVDATSDEISVRPRAATMEKVNAAIATTSIGALVFSVAAGVATVIAVGQAISRHLGRSQPDQAVLSAVGLPRRDRAGALAMEFVPVAAVAALLAAAVAVVASVFTPFGAARRFEPEPGLHVDVNVLVVGAAVVAGVVGLLGAVQAWRAARLECNQAGRRPTVSATFAERAGAGPALTTGVRLAFEHGHGRRTVPSRSVLTAAVLGAAAVIGAVCYAASLDRLVAEPIRWGWAWDLMVEVDADRVEGAVAVLRDVPEISGVATISDRQVIIEGQSVRGQSVDVHQGAPPVVVHAGRLPVGADEIALGSALSRRFDRDVGDTVTVTIPDGSREFTVVGRVTSYPLDGDGLGDGVVLDSTGLDGVASSAGFESLALSASEATSMAQLVEAITPLIDDDIVELSAYGYPRRPDEVVNASSLRVVPWALAAFLGVLAIAGAGHGVHTTVRRRQGDLAVLRALGFRPADVRTSSSWHGACIAVVAIAAGIPLGIVAGRLAFRTLSNDVGVEGGFVVPVVGLTVSAVVACVALLLLAVVPGMRTARESPSEVLRSE